MTKDTTAGGVEAVREALRRAADEAYRVCAETRHVTLGNQARAAVLALTPPATGDGAGVAEADVERAAIRIIRNRASDGPSADRAVAHARQFDTDVWRDAKRDARSALAASPAPAPAAGVEMVLAEVERATAKFPTWPTDPLHALSVLGEEFGELTKETLQLTYEPHKSTIADFRKEAIQTAAMALRFVASLDSYQFTAGIQHKQAVPSPKAGETGNG